jgi:hypothetical protein
MDHCIVCGDAGCEEEDCRDAFDSDGCVAAFLEEVAAAREAGAAVAGVAASVTCRVRLSFPSEEAAHGFLSGLSGVAVLDVSDEGESVGLLLEVAADGRLGADRGLSALRALVSGPGPS